MASAPPLSGPPLARGAHRPARGRAASRRAAATRGARSSSGCIRGRLGLGGFRFLALLALRSGRLRLLRFGLAVRLGFLFLRAVQIAPVILVRLEVSLVPAATFEAEHRYRHELLQGAFAAGRTAGEWRIADLLHDLGVVLAGLALVFVEGHELSRSSCCRTIITKGRPDTTPTPGRHPPELERYEPPGPQPRAARRSSALAKVSCPSCTLMRIRSPGTNSLCRIFWASGFSICCWMARFSGRAPYTGSKPASPIRSRAESSSVRSMFRSCSRLRRYTSWISTIARICFVPRGWNTTMSSMRFMNSGRKLCCTISMTALFIFA